MRGRTLIFRAIEEERLDKVIEEHTRYVKETNRETVAPPVTTTTTVPTITEATTAQPLTTTGGAPPENVPYMTYGIIAVIAVVILAAVFALRSRGKKKS